MQNNDTPLHLAAFKGYSDTVHTLIKVGASLDAINKVSISIFEHFVITIHDCDLIIYMLLQRHS